MAFLSNRDRGEPRGSSPPTPPHVRITYAAVRRIQWSGYFPAHRSAFSPHPTHGFILSDAIPHIDTTATAPLLQAPRGAPFGPSSPSGAARPICCPAFRHRGASIASPATGLLCPLLTSPGRSVSVARHPVLSDNRETSQGKTPIVPRVNAGFIKHTPLRMEDFAVTCPLVPGVPHLESGSCTSPRAFGLGFLQTPPHDDALALLLAFGSANTWHGDFHPARSVPCLAHTPRFSGGPRSGPSAATG